MGTSWATLQFLDPTACEAERNIRFLATDSLRNFALRDDGKTRGRSRLWQVRHKQLWGAEISSGGFCSGCSNRRRYESSLRIGFCCRLSILTSIDGSPVDCADVRSNGLRSAALGTLRRSGERSQRQ